MSENITTLILLAYRQADYVEAAVRAALDQHGPSIEILLSDDCSPDETYGRMKRLVDAYDGPHRVKLFQNETNLGITAHLARMIARASGELLVLSAGDDISRPDRVARLRGAWEAAGRPPAVLYSDYMPIGMDGRLLEKANHPIFPGPHRIEDIAAGTVQVLGASSAITRNLVTDFPPILPRAVYEDRIYPFRALLRGGAIIFVDAPLIEYRLHVGVSQARAADQRDYLSNFSRKLEETKLMDAIQRLYDLCFVDPQRAKLRRACERAVLTHEARIRFAERARAPEWMLLTSLFTGAAARASLRLYLKHRFFLVARYFMKV